MPPPHRRDRARTSGSVVVLKLPARYHEDWRAPFDTAVGAQLFAGMRILDVGSGRTPTLEPRSRPKGCRYVGLDLSESELAAAGPGAYDEILVGDIAARDLALRAEQYDLALSWQVLEHVSSLQTAVQNVHRSLRPGGHFIAQLSGGRSLVALANRIVPSSLAKGAMHRLLARDPASVFEAQYDRCTFDALASVLAVWSSADITPRFRAAGYFGFLPPAQWLYLKYEDWTFSTDRRNLATHYLIDAIR